MKSIIISLCVFCLFFIETSMAQNKTGVTRVAVSLDSLKESYTASQDNIEADWKIQNKAALASYSKTIDAALQTLKGKGDLDGVLTLQKEGERFKNEKTVLQPGGSGRPFLLVKAISDYAEALNKADTAKDERRKALAKQYVGQLDELTKKLVMADKIEEAKQVREEADVIRSGGPVSAVPPPQRLTVSASAPNETTAQETADPELLKLYGKWHVHDPGNGWTCIFEFYPKGEAYYTCQRDGVPRKQVTWEVKNGQVEVAGARFDSPIKPEGMGGRLTSDANPRFNIKKIEDYTPPPQIAPAGKTDCPNCRGTGRCQNSRCANGKITTEKIGGKIEESTCPTCKGTGRCNKCTNLSSSIPPDAKIFRGHSYRVYFETKTWQEAKKSCQEKGGHLVTIQDDQENSFAFQLTNQRTCWIGCTDEEKEGQWKWVDNSNVTYSYWTSGEPNNMDGRENYGGFFKGMWNDFSAEARADGYICEWDK